MYMKELFVKHPLSEQCVALTTTTALGNLAYQVDEGKDVKEHRNLLAELLFILPNRFTYVYQSHSDKVMKVTPSDFGKGKDSFESRFSAVISFSLLYNLIFISLK